MQGAGEGVTSRMRRQHLPHVEQGTQAQAHSANNQARKWKGQRTQPYMQGVRKQTQTGMLHEGGELPLVECLLIMQAQAAVGVEL